MLPLFIHDDHKHAPYQKTPHDRNKTIEAPKDKIYWTSNITRSPCEEPHVNKDDRQMSKEVLWPEVDKLPADYFHGEK